MKDLIFSSDLTTLRDWIRFAVSQFGASGLYYGHGTDNALDEAILLILSALYLPLDLPDSLYQAVLTRDERKIIYTLIQDRIHTRKPAPYLINQAFFMGLPFYVDPRVLIPRSPLAELIQKAFSPWLPEPHTNPLRILDLCTGSGCIAIACATVFPEAIIVASDISTDALAVADINLKKHAHKCNLNNISLVQSDLFSQINLPCETEKFDIIISNPPYVDKIDMDTLPPEYLHEPVLALSAGEDGLMVISKILAQAKNYLSQTGILIVEVGNSANALIQAYPEIDFIWLEFTQSDAQVFLLPYDSIPA